MGTRRDTQDLLIDTLVPGPDPEFDPEFALPRDEHPDFETDTLVDRLVKHYGPGPHPGTGTEQTVHGGDEGVQPQLHDTMFGEEPPTPRTKLTFTYDEEKRRFAETDGSAWGNLFGRDHPALRLVEFGEEDQMVVRHAVEAWENFAPGTLPDELEIRVSILPEDPGTLAWVDIDEPGTDHVVFINDTIWNDEFEMSENLAGIMQRPHLLAAGEEITELMQSWETADAAEFTLKQTAIFHELAHVASKHQGWAKGKGRNWPTELPYYSESWYPEQVSTDEDPTIPSVYALSHPAEFFAEAMTDVWLNGGDAAPLSKKSFDVFMELKR